MSESILEGLVQEREQISAEGRKIIRASDLLKRGVREIPMLFAPVFPAACVSILAGSSDAGKSMLLRNMAICTVTGRDFLGWKYKGKHRSCIFVATEDDEEATSFLLGKHEQGYGDAPDDLAGLRFLFATENIINDLEQELSIEPADLVIVDAYSDVFDGKEQSSAAQTRAFVNKFKKLATEFGCHVLFLHHTGKRTEDLIPSKNNFVGSQSLEASVRLGIELRVDRQNPDLRHLCVVKGNYLGNQYKMSSFVLKMDSNFVFTNTNDRVSFDELALTPSQGNVSSGRKSINPSDFAETQHRDFLTTHVAGRKLSTRNMLNALHDFFGVSKEVGYRFIDYYTNEGYIQNASKSNSKYEYELRDNQLPF